VDSVEAMALIHQIQTAILNPGTHPDYHWQQLSELRRNWPTLFNAIMNTLDQTHQYMAREEMRRVG